MQGFVISICKTHCKDVCNDGGMPWPANDKFWPWHIYFCMSLNWVPTNPSAWWTSIKNHVFAFVCPSFEWVPSLFWGQSMCSMVPGSFITRSYLRFANPMDSNGLLPNVSYQHCSLLDTVYIYTHCIYIYTSIISISLCKNMLTCFKNNLYHRPHIYIYTYTFVYTIFEDIDTIYSV